MKTIVLAALTLLFVSAAKADDIQTFGVSGNFEFGYDWYYAPNDYVTLDVTTGQFVDAYLQVVNTPDTFTGAPTTVESGSNWTYVEWQNPDGNYTGFEVEPSFAGFTGGSASDVFAFAPPIYLNWGSTATFTPVSTPETGSGSMLLAGLIGLAVFGLCRQRLNTNRVFATAGNL
jgi:hypothetical protein